MINNAFIMFFRHPGVVINNTEEVIDLPNVVLPTPTGPKENTSNPEVVEEIKEETAGLSQDGVISLGVFGGAVGIAIVFAFVYFCIKSKGACGGAGAKTKIINVMPDQQQFKPQQQPQLEHQSMHDQAGLNTDGLSAFGGFFALFLKAKKTQTQQQPQEYQQQPPHR
jgi:hypothetical protein